MNVWSCFILVPGILSSIISPAVRIDWCPYELFRDLLILSRTPSKFEWISHLCSPTRKQLLFKQYRDVCSATRRILTAIDTPAPTMFWLSISLDKEYHSKDLRIQWEECFNSFTSSIKSPSTTDLLQIQPMTYRNYPWDLGTGYRQNVTNITCPNVIPSPQPLLLVQHLYGIKIKATYTLHYMKARRFTVFIILLSSQ